MRIYSSAVQDALVSSPRPGLQNGRTETSDTRTVAAAPAGPSKALTKSSEVNYCLNPTYASLLLENYYIVPLS